MHITFTSQYGNEPRVGDFTPEVIAFLKEHPEIEDEKAKAYSSQSFNTKEKVLLVLESVAALKYAYTDFMDKKILQTLSENILDYCQTIAEPQPLLEGLAIGTARIVSDAPVTTMGIQAFGVFKKLEKLDALKDFSVEINKSNYIQTERSYKNSEAGRNGLSVFL